MSDVKPGHASITERDRGNYYVVGHAELARRAYWTGPDILSPEARLRNVSAVMEERFRFELSRQAERHAAQLAEAAQRDDALAAENARLRKALEEAIFWIEDETISSGGEDDDGGPRRCPSHQEMIDQWRAALKEDGSDG